MQQSEFCLLFSEIRNTDVVKVGGKNASLGEMVSTLTEVSIRVPDGFAISADAYRYFLEMNQLETALEEELSKLDSIHLSNLSEVGEKCRNLIRNGDVPDRLKTQILNHYTKLGENISVAVRSSATAEDLPSASFAGQHDSFLNIQGEDQVISAYRACLVSLFNDRAIKYRIDHGFDHMKVALSVGVQYMVRSDVGSAGVAFTIDPETGSQNVVYITGAWGLGENVVQGAVNPDEFYLFKPSIYSGKNSLFRHKMGAKENKMIYATSGDRPVVNIETSPEERNRYCISDDEVRLLGNWCVAIEKHYGMPMDIEWAKDGISGDLFIVQARPETVHGSVEDISVREYKILQKPKPVCTGTAVGRSIAFGRVCCVNSLADAGKVQKGDVIVADITNPDWNALLRKAVCIVTNKGGRTSHASIVARELGIHAVVGTGNATKVLRDGQMITVSCIDGDEGQVYDGKVEWEEKEIHLDAIPDTRTKPMFILADPDKAFRLAKYPAMGVGLLRMEFIITNSIRIHPMALVRFDELPASSDKDAIAAMTKNYSAKTDFFVDRLSESIATVAAAFYPREVIVRMSDFKTNEYAGLIGGSMFEPEEENPMLGFRGASRYYHERYREGFGLECEAMRRVRDELGLINVKLMIPFCRTIDEAGKVLETMKSFGLERGKNGLQIYVMAELPSNVILAAEFARLFDGFSIGSNDLTQLTLGIDRDSAIITSLFDENNQAVKEMLRMVISQAKESGVAIGLCGQAPSDHPGFAAFLVEQGIDSISFTPDALLRGIKNISEAEKN
jgi:pyruvate, water dikinase